MPRLGLSLGLSAWRPASAASPPAAALPEDGLQVRYEFQGDNAAQVFTDAGTTPVVSDGDAIYRVADIGGSSVHLNQATAGSRPVWRTSTGPNSDVNGVECSATQFMRATAGFVSPITTTYYFVGQVTNADDSVIFSRGFTSSPSSVQEYLYWNGSTGTASDSLKIYRGGTKTLTATLTTWPVGTWGVIAVVIDGTPASGSRILRIYRDGVLVREETNGTWTVSSSFNATLNLNTLSGTGGQTFGGAIKMLAFAAYDVAHDAETVAAAQSYYAQTLGVPEPPE